MQSRLTPLATGCLILMLALVGSGCLSLPGSQPGSALKTLTAKRSAPAKTVTAPAKAVADQPLMASGVADPSPLTPYPLITATPVEQLATTLIAVAVSAMTPTEDYTTLRYERMPPLVPYGPEPTLSWPHLPTGSFIWLQVGSAYPFGCGWNGTRDPLLATISPRPSLTCPATLEGLVTRQRLQGYTFIPTLPTPTEKQP